MGKLYVEHLLRLGIPADQIVVVDLDPDVLAQVSKKFPAVRVSPTVALAFSLQPKTAFVLTNSPTHLSVLQSLADSTVKHVFCEKPTVVAAHAEGFHALRGEFTTFATGFIINFSAAMQVLLGFMKEHGLNVIQGSGIWQKDRWNDRRPTDGAVGDDLIHATEALLMLTRNGTINSRTYVVSSFIDHICYVDEDIQQAARQRDESFVENPSSNGMIVLRCDLPGRAPVHLCLQCTFVGFRQRREITVLLAKSGTRPSHKAEIVFDTEKGEDVLSINAMGSKEPDRVMAFPSKGKLIDMIQAFLNAASGQGDDPRLTHFREAMEAVDLGVAIQSVGN